MSAKKQSIDRITKFANPCNYDLRVAPVSFLDNQAEERLKRTTLNINTISMNVKFSQFYKLRRNNASSTENYGELQYLPFGTSVELTFPDESETMDNKKDVSGSKNTNDITPRTFHSQLSINLLKQTRSLEDLTSNASREKLSKERTSHIRKPVNGGVVNTNSNKSVNYPEIVVISCRPHTKNIIYSGTSTIKKTIFLNRNGDLETAREPISCNLELESINIKRQGVSLENNTHPRSPISSSKTMPFPTFAMDSSMMVNSRRCDSVDKIHLRTTEVREEYGYSRCLDGLRYTSRTHDADDRILEQGSQYPTVANFYDKVVSSEFHGIRKSKEISNMHDVKGSRKAKSGKKAVSEDIKFPKRRSSSCRPDLKCCIRNCTRCILCFPRRRLRTNSLGNVPSGDNSLHITTAVEDFGRENEEDPFERAAIEKAQIDAQHNAALSSNLEKHKFPLIREFASPPELMSTTLSSAAPNYINVSVSAFGYGQNNMWRSDFEDHSGVKIQNDLSEVHDTFPKISEEDNISENATSNSTEGDGRYVKYDQTTESMITSRSSSSGNSTCLEIFEIRPSSSNETEVRSLKELSSESSSQITVHNHAFSLESLSLLDYVKRIRKPNQFSDKLFRISSELSINTI